MGNRVSARVLAVSIALSGAASAQQDGLLALSFDDGVQGLPTGVEISTQFPAPDFVEGISGTAWRSDGFSSYVSSDFDADDTSDLSVSLWVALESYPSDLEVTVDRLTPSSFINQAEKRRGFDLFVDTFGRWGVWVQTTSGRKEVVAPDVFPLYQWAHAGFRFSASDGILELVLNGDVVAEQRVPSRARIRGANRSLLVAKGWRDQSILNFRINGLNGVFDEIRVTTAQTQLTDFKIAYDARATDAGDAWGALQVPESRFAADHLRPRYHAMPPANWTNEPHGLVFANGRYHLFYQRTPNGPYKTQMHWGHMSSADLVTWKHHRDALWPTLQTDSFGFDMKGIWSGDVIFENGTAYAYYTSVNHFGTYNPGVAVAVSSDPNLEYWDKRGPILDTTFVEDFRDPYLWKEDGVWHMIIGAALKSGGGLDYYTCTNKSARHCWEHQRDFLNGFTFRDLDVGSIIWEMPVFEPLTEDKHLLLVNPIGGDVTKYGEPSTRAIYWIGRWVNGTFIPDTITGKPQDLLPGQLAPTVARLEDGTLVAIGIVDERRTPQAQEDAGWAHTFSLPREWYLMADGQTLGQRPYKVLSELREEAVPVTDVVSAYVEPTLVANPGAQAEFVVTFEPGSDGARGVIVAATADGEQRTHLYFDPETNEIVLDKSLSTTTNDAEGPQILRGAYDITAFGEPDKWHVFVDGSVVDVFINDAAATSFRIYPSRADATILGVYANGNPIVPNSVAAWSLRNDVMRWE